MSYKISSWGKQRLKGALGIIINLESRFDEILDENAKKNESVKKVLDEIESWKKKILDKMQIIESDITKDLIESSL
jgi:hypothetical protein